MIICLYSLEKVFELVNIVMAQSTVPNRARLIDRIYAADGRWSLKRESTLLPRKVIP
jgi:hypothetical protein